MLDAQVVQIENELPVIARSRPAKRHFASERGQPQARRRLMDATSRHEKGKRGGLQPMHRFSQKHEAVGKNMRQDGSGHAGDLKGMMTNFVVYE